MIDEMLLSKDSVDFDLGVEALMTSMNVVRIYNYIRELFRDTHYAVFMSKGVITRGLKALPGDVIATDMQEYRVREVREEGLMVCPIKLHGGFDTQYLPQETPYKILMSTNDPRCKL